jgi:hypothetical protein
VLLDVTRRAQSTGRPGRRRTSVTSEWVAISSGLSPQAGLYCAVITGFLISALGGSRFQIGGPTGAFVVVVAGIVATHGIDGRGPSSFWRHAWS